MLEKPDSLFDPVPVNASKDCTGPERHRNKTSSSGARTGSWRKIRVSNRLNTAAAAPMPIASDATATIVTIGVRRNIRRP